MRPVKEEKRELRRKMRERIAELPSTQREEESDRCGESLFSLSEWREARSILVFVSLKGEIATLPGIEQAIAESKEIALPRMHGDQMYFHFVTTGKSTKKQPENGEELYAGLERHPYGILEPPQDAPCFSQLPKDELAAKLPALVLTPGLAFDREGRRLGRGKGYYDKWFGRQEELLRKGFIRPVALGFSIQLIENVPADAKDRRIPLLDIAGSIIQTRLQR